MKSTVENLSPTRVKLAVEVPYEELRPSLDEAYKTIGAQVQVPGFRQGKVPQRIIDQRVGRGAVVQEAVNAALPDLFTQAVVENDLRPLGQPELEFTDVPVAEGDELRFTAEVDVVPAFELPDTDGIEVQVQARELEDSAVDERLDTLRQRFGTLVGVDRAAQDGDFVSIDLRATIDGEEIDQVEGVSYEIGSGNMLEGMDENLIGMTAGETKSFTAPLAGGDREGQDAEVTVTVQSVKERELPEADDDFAQMASEFDTLAELRESLRGQAEQQLRFEQGIEARDKILEMLLDRADIAVPESIVEAEVNSHLEGEGRLEDAEHRAEVTESTQRAIRAQFLLDALADKREVQVEQAELIEYLIMQSQQYGMDPNQFAQMMDQQGQVGAMMGEVRRRKALAEVLDGATITDTDGQVVNLDDITGDDADTDVEALDADDAAEVEAGADAEPQAQDAPEADAQESSKA